MDEKIDKNRNNQLEELLIFIPIACDHHEFDARIIKYLANYFDVLVTYNSSYGEIKFPDGIRKISVNLISKSNLFQQFEFLARSFCIHLNSFFQIQPPRFLFLNYDTKSMVFFSWLCRRLYLVCHNNIRGDGKRKFAFSMIRKNATHLVFSKDMASSNYFSRRDVFIVGLPLEHNLLSSLGKDLFAIVDEEARVTMLIDSLLKLDGIDKVYVRARGATVDNEKICMAEKFESFDSIFSTVKIVLIDKVYNYRISSIALKTILHGKFLIMRNSSYARELKSEYPKQVFVYEDDKQITDLILGLDQLDSDLNNSSGDSFDSITRHNDRSLNLFLDSLLSKNNFRGD